MQRTKRLVVACIVTIITVILAGSVVRASGSGLGCPHWPACFEESFFPPLSAEGIPAAYRESEHVNLQKTWTEWINRLLGFLGGLLMLGTTIHAWLTLPASRRGVAWLITASGFLYAFQGVQGAMVVKYELDPRFVTVHLVIALTILFMLISAWLRLRAEPVGFEHEADRPALLTKTRWLLALALVQFLLGALLRGTLEVIAADRPELARGEWIAEAGAIDWAHRILAFGVMGSVMLLGMRLRALGSRDRLLDRAVAAAQLVVVLQIASGLVLIEWDLRPAVQVIHIVLGNLLLGALFTSERLLGRRAVAELG